MKMANLMASSKATVPKHLQGNEGDCAAVILQSMNWGMKPVWLLLKKTHLVNGTLGYEAQLVNAVVMGNNHITGRFHYENTVESAKIWVRVGCGSERRDRNKLGSWLRNGRCDYAQFSVVGIQSRSATSAPAS